MPETAIDYLNELLEVVRKDLVLSTGGQSVCAIHKSGSPSDILKFNEGKEFILRRIISLLNKSPSQEEIRLFLSEQERTFHAYQTSDSTAASSSWRSYAEGGLDGIAAVKKILAM